MELGAATSTNEKQGFVISQNRACCAFWSGERLHRIRPSASQGPSFYKNESAAQCRVEDGGGDFDWLQNKFCLFTTMHMLRSAVRWEVVSSADITTVGS